MKRLFIILLCVFAFCIGGCTYPSSKEADHADTEKTYEHIKNKADSDVRYRWIKAFLDKDYNTCAELLSVFPKEQQTERDKLYSDWYKILTQLTFGDYSVKETDKFLIFSFDIIKSNYYGFNIGSYTYKVTNGVSAAVYWERMDAEQCIVDEDIRSLITIMAPHIWSFENPQDNLNSHIDNRIEKGIFYVLYFCQNNWLGNNGAIDEADISTGAYEMFGVKDYEPPKSIADYNENGYSLKYLGAPCASFDIVEVKKTGQQHKVYVQFYADSMKVIKSYYVEYIFEKTDSEYRYKIQSAEVLDEGTYSPFTWVL